jgi:hypothetical protein
MHIYSVVNVENLKLYEPFMLDREEEQVLPSIEDLAPEGMIRIGSLYYFSSISMLYG